MHAGWKQAEWREPRQMRPIRLIPKRPTIVRRISAGAAVGPHSLLEKLGGARRGAAMRSRWVLGKLPAVLTAAERTDQKS